MRHSRQESTNHEDTVRLPGHACHPPTLHRVSMASVMRMILGYDAMALARRERLPVAWDSERMLNPHMLIVGKSGAGKTHLLRNMTSQLLAASAGRLRIHILDVHGDIDIDGSSTVKFSESTSYGFNPLTINADPDFGGVRKRVQSLIAALGRTGYRLGLKQEAVLRNLLYDLYAANGFRDGDPASWALRDPAHPDRAKHNPTLDDAVRFSQAKLRAMFLGTSARTVEALEKLYRKQASFQRLVRQGARARPEEREALQKTLHETTESCVALFREHLEHMEHGHELDDLLKYDSREVMKGVVERLENLRSIGIFRPQRPPFDRANAVWRYDIKALLRDEQKLFVSFILEAILNARMQQGMQNDVRELVVLDEAHLFVDEDADNPVNIIAREGRKFGLGLFAASQSPNHFSEDFLSNVASKVILGIDQMYWDTLVRRFKVDPKALEWIVLQKRVIMQLAGLRETRTPFQYVDLNG